MFKRTEAKRDGININSTEYIVVKATESVTWLELVPENENKHSVELLELIMEDVAI